MSTFTAKYGGRCNSGDCDYGDHISPGDEVEYVDDDLMHTACASRARRYPPLCNACFEHHRGECL
ncbi:hypothetical protein BN000_00622 [Mycobacterium europaeum]|uniref:Uncharacterized protein n=1 Tax=Mycobacterium europaeum TaxID=761804 RepID=A0A0U1D0F7_9MYCO|nr:hypothetical protein [Mycobacterium europaeum]CQD03688.1 hypothetical protein BN000_00622 [Mycobacterium europaeum]